MNLIADGYIGGVQITLSHGSDFSLELTDKAMVADYRTNGNSTTLIVVVPEGEEIFTSKGDFEVVDVIVANSEGQMDVSVNDIPTVFSLGAAYPNPFNPSTNLKYLVAEDGNVSIAVYNLQGRLIKELINDFKSIGSYEITWDANNVPSGVYFVRMSINGFSSMQKVMLIK